MTFLTPRRMSLALIFLGTSTLHAFDATEPIFDIVSLEAIVDGQGFAGMPGNDELWTVSDEAATFDEFPINIEATAHGPLGGESHGLAKLDGTLVPTGFQLAAHATSSSLGGENDEWAMTWAQVHGSVVFDVHEAALL